MSRPGGKELFFMLSGCKKLMSDWPLVFAGNMDWYFGVVKYSIGIMCRFGDSCTLP